MTRSLAAAVLAALVLTGCGPDDKPQPARSLDAATTARPGAYCRQVGQRAVTDTGTPVVCTTTAADSRPRWRTGQLDLPRR